MSRVSHSCCIVQAFVCMFDYQINVELGRISIICAYGAEC